MPAITTASWEINFLITLVTREFQEDLDSYFGAFGNIKDSVIMVEKATGKPRGFAFVEVKRTNLNLSRLASCPFDPRL